MVALCAGAYFVKNKKHIASLPILQLKKTLYNNNYFKKISFIVHGITERGVKTLK